MPTGVPSSQTLTWSDAPARRSRPLTEAHKLLGGLSTEKLGTTGLSARTQHQVLRFLSRVTKPNSTFAAIVPDDDGVAVVHWAAGGTSLQIDIDADGPSYLWTHTDGKSVSFTQPAAIYNVAERVLKAMATAADEANPQWPERMQRP